jgi:hypothetical protein
MDKLPNPFLPDPESDFPRGFDQHRFEADIADPLPESFTSPSREFLVGCGLDDLLEILARH